MREAVKEILEQIKMIVEEAASMPGPSVSLDTRVSVTAQLLACNMISAEIAELRDMMSADMAEISKLTLEASSEDLFEDIDEEDFS